MLEPVAFVSPAQLAAGQRALVRDLAWASMSGAFSGGVILLAFALALGAKPLHVGLLAAIPFMAQAAQLPATILIERVRQRRKIGVMTISAARLVVFAMAALPFVSGQDAALTALIVAQLLIAGLNAIGGCAVNSWLHQLIPHRELGHFFARRLFSGTALACVGTLAAGWLVDHGSPGHPLHAYALAFGLAGLAGLVSSFYLGSAPEPQMPSGGPLGAMRQRLMEPFGDRNFRRLLVFLGAWTIASNLAAPFLAVYLMQQRGYSLGTVTGLWVASQVASALTLYLWGRLSDRFSNKAVLAVALPVHFGCLLSLVFVDAIEPGWQLGVLYAIHVVMGIATGGIALATGNLGLKLAPQGRGTAYLAAIGLCSAVAGGIAPLVAGALAETFQATELTGVLRWTSWGNSSEMALVRFAHWEFLFAIAAVLGLYVMHALSRIDEGREVSERLVVQEFALEAWRSLNGLSSVAGALFPFERFSERRKWWRSRDSRPSS